MIRVIIVDDELPALKMAQSVLKAFDNVFVCGVFSDQDQLLECIPTLDANLVLLDIKMPGMYGLELAEYITEIRPDLFIVFVTAYDSYAVDAYEADALDYIMKPITEERMKKTLDRYLKRCEINDKDNIQRHILIHSFGRFSVESDLGEKMKFRTVKTEELFAFLVHHQGKQLSKDRIMDELWYDRDLEKAQSMLYTTLYQLRKDLESFGLTSVIHSNRKDGGSCSLQWTPDEWDYKELMEICKQYKDGCVDIKKMEYAVSIYQNGYLADHGYRWAMEEQVELELNYTKLLECVVNNELQNEKYEFALPYLGKLAEIVPFSEQIHTKMIAIYLLLNNKEAAYSYYQKLKEIYDGEDELQVKINLEELISNPYLALKEVI